MSNINPQNIDGSYPIAGQDNNSQGFRDNFTNIINNFKFAAAELTDLQTLAIVKAPLGSVGQSQQDLVNDMNYSPLTAPRISKSVETIKVLGNISSGGSSSINWADGHFQTIGVSETATLSFSSTWPVANLWTKLRLRVISTGVTALTFPSTVTQNISNLRGYAGGTTVYLEDGEHEFEFSTYDNGSNISVEDVRKNYGPVIQHVKPAANIAFEANVGATTVLITPTEAISPFGVEMTLPNTTVHGTVISISSNVAIDELSVVSSDTVSPAANILLAQGTSVEYMYISEDSTWYKIR